MDSGRLEAFSDGVFAVTITLPAGLVALYYVFEHTPARPVDIPGG